VALLEGIALKIHPHDKLEKLAEIGELAIKFREASKITDTRVNSEEFWATAGPAEIDEIELEETLARLELFHNIDKMNSDQPKPDVLQPSVTQPESNDK
jgi:hypothetical protein